MFERTASATLKRYAKFPVVAVLGPRQSGKTTLVKETFPDHIFLSLDQETTRTLAEEDPERFLRMYDNEHGLIIDEFQYVPRLVSYIKYSVDHNKRAGYFILTASQNFLALQTITETLAGRVGILTLLPLSLHELALNGVLGSVDEVIINGSYPGLYDRELSPDEIYLSILRYLERDILHHIKFDNLSLFKRFVSLCAGRIGLQLNLEALCSDSGVAFATARHWLSLLEASYIIFLVEPHHNNFKKRLVKTPKLFFHDTGLACALLRIDSLKDLIFSPFRGQLFENLIIGDFYKQFCNRGKQPALSYWRDYGGTHEVDCFLENDAKIYPVEIKSAETYNSEFFKGIEYINSLIGGNPETSYVVYGGSENQQRNQGRLLSWRSAGTLVEKLVSHNEK